MSKSFPIPGLPDCPSLFKVPCSCSCGWSGIVDDLEPDVDGEGSLGCPECMKVVEVIVERAGSSEEERSCQGGEGGEFESRPAH